MMRRTWMGAALLAMGLSMTARAETPLRDESTGVTFKPVQTVEGTTYECLGAGVRKVFIVKAYAVAFCLDQPHVQPVVRDYVAKAHPGKKGEALADALEEDAGFYKQLALAPADRLVIMRAVRDIPREKIAGAFRESLGEVLAKDKVEKLVALVQTDLKEGQTALLYSKGNVLTIDIGGQKKTIDDPDIAKHLWDVWLSGKTVSPSLRENLARRAAGQ